MVKQESGSRFFHLIQLLVLKPWMTPSLDTGETRKTFYTTSLNLVL
jgi:hypothetical protein